MALSCKHMLLLIAIIKINWKNVLFLTFTNISFWKDQKGPDCTLLKSRKQIALKSANAKQSRCSWLSLNRLNLFSFFN